MKKISLIVNCLIFAISLFSQSDSTIISKYNDSLFVQITTSYDEEGRETSVNKTYYDSLEFERLIFDYAVNADNQAFQATITQSDEEII